MREGKSRNEKIFIIKYMTIQMCKRKLKIKKELRGACINKVRICSTLICLLNVDTQTGGLQSSWLMQSTHGFVE